MYSIVIVDDRATNRAIYTQLARSLGQDVTVQAFGDAASALDWLKANAADLIVTDYEMPRIDGDEFITRFRAQPGSARVPIMMITVCGQRQKRLRALESGATDFLRAPIDHCEFITRARNLLKLSRSAGDAAPAAEARPEDEIRALLDRCGEGGFALHVIEIVPVGPAPDLSAILRAHVRECDAVARLDPLRYVLLQTGVAHRSDARALARRLLRARAAFGRIATLRAGAALPRAGEDAAACLRAAIGSMREIWRADSPRPVAERWRLAPLVDLASGALVGAQLQDGAREAEFSDREALSVALSCAARTRRDGVENFRLCLRLSLASDDAESFVLRLPPLLAESGVEPARLDLILPVTDMLANGARADRLVPALAALGAGLTFDLGALGQDSADAPHWPVLQKALAQGAIGAIRFSSPDDGGVARARALRARIERQFGKTPVLRAADAASPALLAPLRRAGVGWAQGPCFGAPFALRDFSALLGTRAAEDAPEIKARRA
ncbi:response regulator [Rhodoblastus acidophilus]|uniref:Response regulator n=1 Tax=Candidatus Rhodoblastus alkanivorans TaxID=2954117 RepID=A0ABS9Z393_9HYPH|nr:response regulator [Candidatus Rhodoblastus alkanivorans]MCI4677348.1 response regulator [Candidatus Rhodoblastus alkanivorans]MCI4682083.1 response regulator [Candidatus Rhodoblastus alkanivorans]MDI4639385.1 response regulator [Rhodoblastus acidophilus]